jgi:hypothetical protein
MDRAHYHALQEYQDKEKLRRPQRLNRGENRLHRIEVISAGRAFLRKKFRESRQLRWQDGHWISKDVVCVRIVANAFQLCPSSTEAGTFPDGRKSNVSIDAAALTLFA